MESQVMNGVELKAGVLQYEPASLPGTYSYSLGVMHGLGPR